MNDFSEGDLIEATDGERRVIERVQLHADYERLWIPLLGFIGNIAADGTLAGFTLKTIEKATPPLPTVPGVYVRASRSQNHMGEYHTDHRELYYLNTSGKWADVGWGNDPDDGNVTLLEPVAETAKKVLDRVADEYRSGPPQRFVSGILQIVGEGFGVSGDRAETAGER